jgi:hypothetical protein
MTNNGLLGSIVTERTVNDVILGKGFRCREYCGTKHFHSVVRRHVQDYESASEPEEKHAVAERIVRSITQLDPPGRFLRELSKEEAAARDVQPEQEGAWIVLDSAVVLKKTKQALRDSRRIGQKKPAKVSSPSVSTAAGPRPLQPLLPKLPFLQRQYEAHPRPSSIVGILRHFGVMEAPMSPRNTAYPEKRAREAESSAVADLPSSSLFEGGPMSAEEEETGRQLLGLLTSTETRRPAFSELDVLRERESLMEEERVAALTDLFGGMCDVAGQTAKRLKRPDNGPIDEMLADMRQAIDKMAPECKSALLLAMRRASPREFDDDRLELFLHREDMNPEVSTTDCGVLLQSSSHTLSFGGLFAIESCPTICQLLGRKTQYFWCR